MSKALKTLETVDRMKYIYGGRLETAYRNATGPLREAIETQRKEYIKRVSKEVEDKIKSIKALKGCKIRVSSDSILIEINKVETAEISDIQKCINEIEADFNNKKKALADWELRALEAVAMQTEVPPFTLAPDDFTFG